MFEKIENDLKTFDFGDKTRISIGSNVYLSDENFKNTLNNIDNLSDEEAEEFVRKSYRNILYKIATRIDTSYLAGFTTVKFLTALHKVIINEGYKLPEEYHIYCNTIAYDYLSLDQNKKDEVIANLLFNISRVLNRNIINILLGSGLTEQLASYLALSYRSASEDSVSIPRVNFVLLHENPNFMNVQRIVYIYEKLYNSITSLFINTMCDVIDFSGNITNCEDKKKIYSYEADAVVTILNNMPSQMIHTVLTAFYDHCIYNNYLISNIRYSLRALPVDENNNSRVLDMIDYIYSHEGKFIM